MGSLVRAQAGELRWSQGLQETVTLFYFPIARKTYSLITLLLNYFVVLNGLQLRIIFHQPQPLPLHLGLVCGGPW